MIGHQNAARPYYGLAHRQLQQGAASCTDGNMSTEDGTRYSFCNDRTLQSSRECLESSLVNNRLMVNDPGEEDRLTLCQPYVI